MPYCMYLRKSRADADMERLGEGETLARHRRTLTELAERGGYDIGEIYEEIVSGETLAARPQMQRLLADVEAGRWRGVLVMELERLARGNSIDQGIVMQAFTVTGTLIVTPAKVYDPRTELDEEYLEFGLFMSRREYKTINRRLAAGMHASSKEGNWIHSYAPYGYDRVRLEKGRGWTLAPNPVEAPFVRMIFEWYVRDGLTPGKIADKLDALGAVPRGKGAHFPAATIRDMLKNETYAGRIAWHKRPHQKIIRDGKPAMYYNRNADDRTDYAGKHEPLIDAETFAAAQERIGRNPRAKKATDLANPFAGLVYCRECGRAIIYRRYPNASDALICANKYCECSMIGYHIFEAFALDQLTAEIGALKLRAPQAADPLTEQQVNAVCTQLQKLRRQQDSLYDLLEQGVYSPQVFAERKAAVAEKLTAAEAELVRLRERQQKPADITRLADTFADLLTHYDDLTNSEKNALLSRCVKRITYYRPRSRRYSPQPFELKIELKL